MISICEIACSVCGIVCGVRWKSTPRAPKSLKVLCCQSPIPICCAHVSHCCLLFLFSSIIFFSLQCRITLHEALCGVRTTVQSLDGRMLRIEAPHVTPDTVKILPGEGMPNSKVSNVYNTHVFYCVEEVNGCFAQLFILIALIWILTIVLY